MDTAKAHTLEAKLLNKEFSTYHVRGLLNHGKSAAVFKATDISGRICALKIFDEDLVEKFGSEVQIKRIEQEIDLKDHGIANLVNILAGGHYEFEGRKYYFIVMEFIEGKNLKQYIATESYNSEFVLSVLETLYRVSQRLLTDRNIVHRDIKPENIMVTTEGQIILMDFGVLKIIDHSSFTDIEKKEFLGTLRYAPPEFLTREEKDTVEGWCAVNLYQIGGVLHDLIMKRELFQGVEPYGKLIQYILNEPPLIAGLDYPFALLQLSRNMLTKNWLTRLRDCSPERIAEVCHPTITNPDLDSLASSIFSQADPTRQLFEEVERQRRTEKEKLALRQEISQNLEKAITDGIVSLQKRNFFNRVNMANIPIPVTYRMSTNVPSMPTTSFNYMKMTEEGMLDKTLVYKLEGEKNLGYFYPICLLVRTENDEQSSCSISVACIVQMQDPGGFDGAKSYLIALAQKLGNQITGSNNISLQLAMLDIFTGVVTIDATFKTHLAVQIGRLIKQCLKSMLPLVDDELSGIQIQHHSIQPIVINTFAEA